MQAWEAALREDLEVQLHEESSKLRDLLFNAQPKIWASASISDLRRLNLRFIDLKDAISLRDYV